VRALVRKIKKWEVVILVLIIIYFVSTSLYKEDNVQEVQEPVTEQTDETQEQEQAEDQAEQDLVESKTLRQLADERGILIGTAAGSSPFLKDEQYKQVLAEEFNVVTLENELKFSNVHPQKEKYNFLVPDVMVKFANENNMEVRGHTLVWHNGNPDWLMNKDYTKAEMKAILKEHIQTVMKRYKGKVYAWDVVNEAFDDEGKLRKNIWLEKIGPEYIELSFQWAYEADPQALLFYNDFRNEGMNKKSDAIYKMAKNLRNKGIPIDGIGFQMHTSIKTNLNYAKIEQNFKRLSDIGLQVQITEMDVKTYTSDASYDDKMEDQADIYSKALKVCLKVDNCSAFVTWGFTDRYTPIPARVGTDDYPLLFTSEYQRKPSYQALHDVLSQN
jgi:endo-1,4-beta-xylanase